MRPYISGISNQGFTLYDLAQSASRLVIDLSGNVGIGLTNPGQKLTVAGTIEFTSGGLKFPDSTTQTTAMPSAALTRGITYIAGCDWCGTLDNTGEKTFYYNVVGTMTINSVTCFSDTGTPVINIAKNGSGSGILTSNLTCSPGGSMSNSFSQNTLNVGETFDLMMINAGGSAHRVTVVIKATLN
ncbi:MAG: hypothetical protein HY649_00980 [Acidobacteria bacterium]|nr:hypothetical protein [Acidobacteriota bacterium]